MTLSGASTLSLSGPGSNGNKVVFHIPQSSSNAASPSYGFKSYSRTLIGGGSYPSAEMKSIYFYSPNRLGYHLNGFICLQLNGFKHHNITLTIYLRLPVK